MKHFQPMGLRDSVYRFRQLHLSWCDKDSARPLFPSASITGEWIRDFKEADCMLPLNFYLFDIASATREVIASKYTLKDKNLPSRASYT